MSLVVRVVREFRERALILYSMGIIRCDLLIYEEHLSGKSGKKNLVVVRVVRGI